MVRIPFWPGRENRENRANPGRSAADHHALEREQFETVLQTFKASRIDERLAVLDIFLSVEQHLTLAELEELVRKRQGGLPDRDFLRETMAMFCQFGFAQEQSFENRETVYEHQHLGAHHDHFICTRCGKIQEFADDELERLQLAIARQFQFHPLQHKMEIYGLCGRCLGQRQATLPLTMAARGERVKIVELVGGRQVQARLQAMGLTPGVCVEVVSNQAAGQFIIAVQETRLALGTGIAQHVLVSHDCHHREV